MWNNDDEHKLPGVIFCYSKVWCDLILAQGWSPPPVRSCAHQHLETSPLKGRLCAALKLVCVKRVFAVIHSPVKTSESLRMSIVFVNCT